MRVFILKPDAIGDFILATGCLRLLARELGEKNLILAVRADVAQLARCQFPEAETIPLPLRERRRIVNVTTVNVIHCLPAWIRMARLRVDASLCLRSMRAYLHTIFFYTPAATRRIACENLLLSNPRVRRPAVENFARRTFNPTLVPYPAPGKLPTDIEANRLVISALLGRDIAPQEVLPTLTPLRPARSQNCWRLCPFSSTKSKDYPVESWAAALHLLHSRRSTTPLHLAAGPNQQDRLHAFANSLRASGIDNVHLDPPAPLSEFLQAVAESRLLLTVDTAAAHFACALGTPAVIVSAGQHPGVYSPYSPNGRQTWLLPSPSLPKGEWRKAITPEKIASTCAES